jgi:CubicO group peptidase (beta-lactamase class C family)
MGSLVRTLWLFTLIGTAAPAQTTPSPDSARRALAEVANRAEALGVSGVILVASGKDVVLHRGLGWRDSINGSPNDTTTLFYIASLAKQFVATAVLQLEDEGRLRTSDSLAKFFPDAPPDKRRITVDQLLSHTSGLGRYGWDAGRRDWALEDESRAVAGILAMPLSVEPGTQFSYQNTNYLLLAAIIERATGVAFDGYLNEHLFRRAGMRDTYVGSRVTDALRKRVAWSLGDEAETFTIMDRAPSWLWHGRGILTTAADFHRWIRAIESGAILSPASRKKLFAINVELGPRYGYGAGWFVRADSSGAPRVAFHGGDFGSYHSEVRVYPPSGLTVIALTNVGFRGGSLTESLLNQAVEAARRGRVSLPSVARSSTASAATLTGEYRSSDGDGLVVRPVRGSIAVEGIGQRSIDWVTRGDTTRWRDRHVAAERSLAVVAALRIGDTTAFRRVTRLDPATQREIRSEWTAIARVGGRLKSFQLLGAVARGDVSASVGIVRLKFARDSLLYAIGWQGDSLSFTIPGAANLVAPRVFAPSTSSTWVSYDWTDEVERRIVAGSLDDGTPTLTLGTATGPVVFSRVSHRVSR